MSTPSTITLRALAEDIRASFDCNCEVEDEFARAEDCPCAGDSCWKCAAAQALANDNESAEVAALREKLATARRLLETVDAIMVPVNRAEARAWWDARDRALAPTPGPAVPGGRP